MRELRVEDALLYLDQVKVEFGDRPHIYNEFLDIMKTFKTQQIDTPGVIRRVSNLFQGNRRLVLGFNTFLPEGYRIEIPMDGNGPPVAVYRAPGSNVAHILRESAESQAVSVSQQSASGGGVGPPPQQQQQHYHPGGMPGGIAHQQQRLLSPQGVMAEHHSAGGGLPFGPPSLNRQPQQQQQAPKPPQHSMLPLTDAGGVVLRPMTQQQQPQRPMDGGMGQHQQQLPGGVAPRMVGNSMQHQLMNNNMQQQRGKEMMQLQAMQQQQMGMSQPPQMQHVVGPPPMNNTMSADGSAFGGAAETMNASPPAALGGGGGQPLEFDHAINYVTTIKRRFASEPETYKKFLEILHTYQKEQRGIKEVLDEVSELFEDHPDLLKEFTFFLPDAVQATAKMQLDQAAKESENRKRSKAKAAIMNAAQAMQRQAQQQQTASNKPSHDIHSDRAVAAPSGGPYQPPTSTSRSSSYERENLISRGARYGTVLFDPVRPPRKQQAVKPHGRPRTVPELPISPTTTEEAFFQHAKEHLNRKELASDKPSGSRRHTPHSEFLKCLHLFGAGVLSKEELTSLLRVLFLQGHAPKTGVNAGGGYHNPSVANSAAELMREYEEVLIGRGPYADQQVVLKDKSKYGSLRIRDFDLFSATQVSPSYFTYPNDYPHALFLSFPGQTALDESVLNSSVICVHSNSNEDLVGGGGSTRSSSGNGKHHRSLNGVKRKYCPSIEESDGSKQRCNVYEEMMFRIEDERFELDMAIERNAHALRRIEPFAKEAQAFREQEEKDGQPIGRLRYQLHRSSLNTIHINAIGRIYGDRGDEILQHLLQNPLIVLPVVFQRLKQKDTEWRNARNELSERWSAICEANYEGCLDTQCYFNRKALEKSFSAVRLLEQCRKARFYVKYPDKTKIHPATRFYAPKFGKYLSQPGALIYQPYMEVSCRVDVSHKYALELIFNRLKHSPNVTSIVRERIGRIWAEFLLPWFHYPVHWVNMEVRDSFRGRMNPSVTKFISGQRVCTIFGEGTVASFMDSSAQSSGPKYRVKFSFGLGHLSPAAILYAVQSNDSLFVRRDGIMVRDENAYYGSDSISKLDSNQQILFATECTYQFLRLFLILCSLIADTRDHITKFPPLDDPADFYVTKTNAVSAKNRKALKLDYSSVMSALRLLFKNEMNERDFETLARKISRDKVHEIATMPVLVDRCIESLVRVAEEDTLLHLFDYCNVKNVDPLAAQSQCLAVAPDAFYRIQRDTSEACLRFCYLEGRPLLTSPPDDNGDAYIGGSSYGFDMDDEDMNNGMDTGDDDAMDEELVQEHVVAPPEPKRSKLT